MSRSAAVQLLTLMGSCLMTLATTQDAVGGLSHALPEHRSDDITSWIENVKRSDPSVDKWRHYFPAYARHLGHFRGKSVRAMEIGIHSGGSLRMWRWYFGEKAQLYGADIEKSTRRYINNTRYGRPANVLYASTHRFERCLSCAARCPLYVLVRTNADPLNKLCARSPPCVCSIGDQGSPLFWSEIAQKVPQLDVIIDDGGHTPPQQLATLKAALQMLAPGGVLISEDVHGARNAYARQVFTDYIESEDGINAGTSATWKVERQGTNKERIDQLPVSSAQNQIFSITFYAYVVVVEKLAAPFSKEPRIWANVKGGDWNCNAGGSLCADGVDEKRAAKRAKG